MINYDFIHKVVIAYIDNILINSPDITSHVKHVRLVLQKLLQHQLYIKGEKWELHKDCITFLWYNIDTDGVSMETYKSFLALQTSTADLSDVTVSYCSSPTNVTD